MAKRVKIYTDPACPYCMRAKMLLKRNGLNYDETTVAYGSKELEELSKLPHSKSLPQIFIDGKFIGGLAELEEWLKHNK
jgi:glutaredoxin 3